MFDVNIPAKLMVIIAILVLQGCGHKGPLMLPASQVQAPQVPAASQPVPDAQNPGTPATQPAKQP